MKLVIKEKAFTILDQYDIKDEDDNVVYKVKGKIDITKRLDVYDAKGECVGKIKEKMIKLVPHYEIFMGDEHIGDITKDIFKLVKDKYSFDYNDWKIKGDLINFNYDIKAGVKKVAEISRKAIRIITPTYVIDVANKKDVLPAVLVAVAIFAMQDDAQKEKKSL